MTIDQSKTQTYCCRVFEQAIQSYASKGMSIVPRTDPTVGLYFDLEFHVADEEHRGCLKFTGPPNNVLISIRSQDPIKYCPWCAADLQTFYRDRSELLSRYMQESSLRDF